MSRLASAQQGRSGYPADQGQWRSGPSSSGGLTAGTVIGGLALVGLGYLAWTYLWPDLQRYLKIKNM